MIQSENLSLPSGGLSPIPTNISLEIYSKEESILLRVLESFKIKASRINLTKEKFYDHYDISLATGISYSRVDRALTDIGLCLGARAVPTGTLLMSSGIYRLSVQRKELESPPLSTLIEAKHEDLYAPISFGVSSDGQSVYRDLNKIPNLLVAGTTGSGKSVLLHAFIISLLKNNSLIYISDPKSVEFSRYTGLPGVKENVSSPEDTSAMIDRLIKIMNDRFAILKKKKLRSAQELFAKSKSRNTMRPICLIIDEWADLMLYDKGMQKKLCVLAQKGRAAGISIILSTQRPSASVISGPIKANFPGRVALRVTSAIDSRVILGASGAEKISDVGMGLLSDGRTAGLIPFRAPNIIDIEAEMLSVGLGRKKKLGFWSKFIL